MDQRWCCCHVGESTWVCCHTCVLISSSSINRRNSSLPTDRENEEGKHSERQRNTDRIYQFETKFRDENFQVNQDYWRHFSVKTNSVPSLPIMSACQRTGASDYKWNIRITLLIYTWQWWYVRVKNCKYLIIQIGSVDGGVRCEVTHLYRLLWSDLQKHTASTQEAFRCSTECRSVDTQSLQLCS